ncbi:MAG TPA: hypothetical protein VKZ58_08445 [Longimicrobiales bacterium]|nr:hypothetical protein [Longimicrobiales bacterium]
MRFDRWTVTGLLLLLGAAGCATTEFDRHFEANRFDAAARVFARDSSLHGQDRALFRAGIAHALPNSPVYSPQLARSLLERLVAQHPRSSYRDDAERLLALLREIERFDALAASREAELERRNGEIERLHEQIAWLEARFEVQEKVIEVLRQVIERLESGAREKEARIRALQEELDRLKEIDLKPPRSGDGGSAPDSTDA